MNDTTTSNADREKLAQVGPNDEAPRTRKSAPALPASGSDQEAIDRINQALDLASEGVEFLTTESSYPELGSVEVPTQSDPAAVGLTASIIIPVYNEAATIREILTHVAELQLTKQVIVVDDGSTDGTSELLRELAMEMPIELVRHSRNFGKGAALRTGFEQASGDVIVVQDADLEYNPADIPVLLKPIEAGCCDVIYGSRFLAPVETDQSWLHQTGNRMLTAMSNLFTRQNLTDMETCYKVFRREVLEGITIRENGFGVEPELTAKIARRGHRIYEMPVAYQGRSYGEGKKIGMRDGFRAIYCILRYWLAD